MHAYSAIYFSRKELPNYTFVDAASSWRHRTLITLDASEDLLFHTVFLQVWLSCQVQRNFRTRGVLFPFENENLPRGAENETETRPDRAKFENLSFYFKSFY